MEPEGDSDIEMVEEEIDPEVKAMLESAREREQAASRSHAYDDVQPPGYNDPSSPLNEPPEEETQEWIKLRAMWKGPPLPDGKAKWAFSFNLVSLLRIVVLVAFQSRILTVIAHRMPPFVVLMK
jgi:hypothetical protein